jgi:hypothetical protein
MATPASTTTALANISQYLWSCDILKQNAFNSGNLSMNNGRDLVLMVENAALEYGIANNLDGLDGVNNYVYQLVGAKLQQANEIFSTGSGGVVPTPSGSGYYVPYILDVTIDADHAGLTYYQDDSIIGLYGLTELFINQQVFQLDVGFLYNAVSGTINLDLSGSTGNVYTLQLNDKMTSAGTYKIVVP